MSSAYKLLGYTLQYDSKANGYRVGEMDHGQFYYTGTTLKAGTDYYIGKDGKAYLNLNLNGKDYLGVGASGTGVKVLQQILNMMGFKDDSGHSLKLDGLYGTSTAQAVAKFQKSQGKGFLVDGYAGDQTLRALGIGSNSSNGQKSTNGMGIMLPQTSQAPYAQKPIFPGSTPQAQTSTNVFETTAKAVSPILPTAVVYGPPDPQPIAPSGSSGGSFGGGGAGSFGGGAGSFGGRAGNPTTGQVVGSNLWAGTAQMDLGIANILSAPVDVLNGLIYNVAPMIWPFSSNYDYNNQQVIPNPMKDYYVNQAQQANSQAAAINKQAGVSPILSGLLQAAPNVVVNSGLFLWGLDASGAIEAANQAPRLPTVGSPYYIIDEPGRVFTSSDPYVAETANAIESQYPGKVIDVNRIVKDAAGRIITDYDIELDDYIIQVKSGSAKGLTTQIQNTAASTTKTVIGYAPDMNPSSAVVKGVQNAGYNCFTDLTELLNFIGR